MKSNVQFNEFIKFCRISCEYYNLMMQCVTDDDRGVVATEIRTKIQESFSPEYPILDSTEEFCNEI